jgi:hypothetical protein
LHHLGRKYVFKNRCLAELNIYIYTKRRIKWLIAICWNNHNDDDVKGHTWQKYAIVRPYGNNMIEQNEKRKT